MKEVAQALIFVVLAALWLTGCGKAPEPPGASQPAAASPTTTPVAQPAATSPTSTPTAQQAAASRTSAPPAQEEAIEPVGDQEKELNIFCWSEYVPQEIIDAFSQETGIKVSMENYSSNEEMLAKLLAGGGKYDLIQPSEYIIEGMIKENLLTTIDHAAIPNIKNIAPEFQNMSFDPGNKFSVPYMAGTVGIVVNTELVQDDIKSFNDVFQDKFKKNIVVLDDAREIVGWGFETLGIPINEVSDENLEKVRPVLKKWLPLVKVFDSDSPKTSLLNGDVALGVVWSGEGAILLNEDSKFKWVIPAEGSHLFIDSLAIPKTAAHVKNAHLFMNFVLRPEVSAKISEAFPYLNPNAAARELLTPQQRNNRASYPTADELAKMQTFKDIGEEASQIDELVTSLKAQ
jgi:spermidine/putrescine transport system substrate-binding protein/spermidine/putrescine transport system permease protein